MHVSTPRLDVYAFIHKGLRAHLVHTLTAVGRCDWQDCAEAQAVLAEVSGLIAFCRAHVEHEDRFVHPLLESRRPGASARTALEHRQHEQELDAIAALAMSVASLPALRRDDSVRALYRALARFVAENFEHMAMEEAENNRVLWETHTDAEIAAMEAALVASIPPEAMQYTLRWMLPALDPAERAAFLGEMRAHAPAEVFDGVLALLRPLLSAAHNRRLDHDLGLSRPVRDYVGVA